MWLLASGSLVAIVLGVGALRPFAPRETHQLTAPSAACATGTCGAVMERTREPDLPDDEAADARRRIEKQLELDEDRETKACQPLAEACKRGGCIPTWSHAL